MKDTHNRLLSSEAWMTKNSRSYHSKHASTVYMEIIGGKTEQPGNDLFDLSSH